MNRPYGKDIIPLNINLSIKRHRKNRGLTTPVSKFQLLEFALSCGFRLLLTLNTRLFIVFSLAKFSEDAGTSALALKATKGTVQGLAFLNSYFCHYCFTPSACCDLVTTILFCYYNTTILLCQENF